MFSVIKIHFRYHVFKPQEHLFLSVLNSFTYPSSWPVKKLLASNVSVHSQPSPRFSRQALLRPKPNLSMAYGTENGIPGGSCTSNMHLHLRCFWKRAPWGAYHQLCILRTLGNSLLFLICPSSPSPPASPACSGRGSPRWNGAIWIKKWIFISGVIGDQIEDPKSAVMYASRLRLMPH